MTNQQQHKPPTSAIVVTRPGNGKLPPPADTLHRAVHKISLSALSHNYSEVESAAQRQRCNVICVTKADSYGHGAIATALYLSDSMGADAFAVATLEEAIALRRAFQDTNKTPAGGARAKISVRPQLVSLFRSNASSDDSSTTTQSTAGRKRSLRPRNIRILVLGPPVGFPRCFDDYYHHNIEVMISGPEVARALFEWVHNPNERKRLQVERAAAETKEFALNSSYTPAVHHKRPTPALEAQRDSTISEASTSENSQASDGAPRYHPPSATLGNVTGSDLANEVRAILKNQQKLTAENQQAPPSGPATPLTVESSGVTPVSSEADLSLVKGIVNGFAKATATQTFAGIEEAARVSRNFYKAVASEAFVDTGEDDEDDPGASSPVPTDANGNPIAANGKPRISTNRNKQAYPPTVIPRKRLRWHALVDSGMGRLGFRTDPVSKQDQGKRRDSVEIIKELVDLEVKLDCPIEFFGMVTHMADANSTSTYTNSQITKFKNLLKRVRAAKISVPTISTDNSAALLTTTLNHFDPKELLTQEFAETRGFVRVGGAIYGQRPAFPQLRAVSTLMVSVRHVAILREGESVGYDRAYVAHRSVRIATLTMGFADGYPRELGNMNGQVAIRGHLFPVVGNVCMDMMMVYLGDAGNGDAAGAEVVVGDTAILWGPADDEEGEGLVPLRELATKLKTTQSALTCGLDKERVRREYA